MELREETLRELCAALRRNRSLRLLGCARAGIDAAGGVKLAAMLRSNTCLTSLDLSRNRLGGGSLEWARALADSLRDNGTLLSLSLAHNNPNPNPHPKPNPNPNQAPSSRSRSRTTTWACARPRCWRRGSRPTRRSTR